MERMPRKMNPKTTSTALTTHMNAPTLNRGNSVASTMDRPDVPPNAKWLGVLNRAMPAAVATSPRFSRKKNSASARICFGVRCFFTSVSTKHPP